MLEETYSKNSHNSNGANEYPKEDPWNLQNIFHFLETLKTPNFWKSSRVLNNPTGGSFKLAKRFFLAKNFEKKFRKGTEKANESFFI